MKRKLVSLLTIAILVSAIFTGCKNEVSDSAKVAPDLYAEQSKAAPEGYVYGLVVDNRGAPVADATVTLGNKSATTNIGGEFYITGVDVNDPSLISNQTTTGSLTTSTTATAYNVTVTKKGYLSAVSTAVYVRGQVNETEASKAYNKVLFDNTNGILKDYKQILNTYAGKDAVASQTTTVVGQGSDAVKTDSTVKATDAKEVMELIAKAMAELKDDAAYQGFYTSFFSTFTKMVMIPCDASFSGQIKLQPKAKNDSVYDEKTYAPTKSPVVRATYKPSAVTGFTGTGSGFYTWETKADKDGKFSFDSCLPSGVSVVFSVDSFTDKIGEEELYFSSENADLMIEGSGAANSFATTGLTLSKGKNIESAVFMLYAQRDKIWITSTNVDSYSSGKLLSTTDDLVFTFNKAMKKLDVTAVTGINISKDNYTITWSADNKTATLKPVDDHWSITGTTNPTITLTGEAQDGVTTFLKATFTLYFDTKVWVSLADDFTLNDYNDRVPLDSDIKIEFSKAMNGKIALTLTGTPTAYTETWDDDGKVLTISPVTQYWKVTGNLVTVKVAVKGGFSDGTYNDNFGYWKAGSDSTNNCLNVYFDNYVDVTVAKAAVTGKEAFKLTFSKAIKSYDEKENAISIKVAGTNTAVTDFEAELDSTGKILTISSLDKVFKEKGKYEISLAKLEADDGSTLFREFGTKDVAQGYTAGNFKATTEFAFDGFVLKPLSIEIIDELPDTAVASRAVYSVLTSDVLKITFNKPIYKAGIQLKVGNNTIVSPKNYIDEEDPTIVYVPLAEVNAVNDQVVISGFTSVKAVDGEEFDANHSTTGLQDITADLWNKFFKDNDKYNIFAAITLVDTNLVKKNNTASDIYTYEDDNVIEAGKELTFTFSDVPAKVLWTLYRADGTNPATKVEEGEVATSTATATIKPAKLISVAEKADGAADRLTNYYIDIHAVNAAGVTLFSTTNAWTLNAPNDTFEKLNASIFDNGATNGNGSKLGFGTIKMAVKPLTLVETNLYDADEHDLAVLEAKTDLTFKFDAKFPTGAKAYYYIANGATTPELVGEGDAEIADDTITVSDPAALIIDSENADNTTGISTYYVGLYVTDKDVTEEGYLVLFGSDVNFPLTSNSIEKDLTNEVYDANEDAFLVNIKPITVVAADKLVTRDVSFGDTTADGYTKADPIKPAESFTLKFSDKFPKDSKVKWAVYDASGDLLGEEKSYSITAATGTDELTFQSDEMVASTASDTTYDIFIQVEDTAGNILFSTANAYFGKSTDSKDFEKALKDNNFIVNNSDYLKVTVVKTEVLSGDDSEVTTTVDQFKESFKSPIALEFSHALPAGYKAVLYSESPIYTITGQTTPTFVDPSTQTVQGVYDYDFDAWTEEFALYVYPSTFAWNTARDTITITPTNLFGTNKAVKVAIYDADGNYVDVSGIPAYTTDSAYNFEELVAAATEKAPETEANKIGNGAAVEFKFETAYSATSKSLATYQFYVKKAEDVDYAAAGTATVGADAEGAALSVVKYRLGRGADTTISTTLANATGADNDAFGYNGKVNVLIIKEIDGVKTAFKAELADALKSDATVTFNGGALTYDSDNLIAGTTALEKTGTNDAIDFADTTITISSNEWIALATVEYVGGTNAGAGTAARKTSGATVSNVTYSADNRTATVTLSDILMFDGDKVNITVKDTSGNEATYSYTFKN